MASPPPAAHALLASAILQDASNGLAAAGMTPLPGTDAALKQQQQQAFMQQLYSTYQQQQQQQAAQPSLSSLPPASEENAEVTNEEFRKSSVAALGSNGILSGRQKAALLMELDERGKQAQRSKELEEKCKLLEKKYHANLEQFNSLITDMAQNDQREKYQKHVAASGNDAESAVQAAYPILVSASATFKAQQLTVEGMQKRIQELEQQLQAATPQKPTISSSSPQVPAPTATPQLTPEQQQQVAMAMVMQAMALQAKQPTAPAPPPPAPAPQWTPSADLMKLVENVQHQMFPPAPALAAPTQPIVAEPQLVTASAQRRPAASGPTSGFTFRGPAADFYGSLRSSQHGVTDADVMGYRRGLGDTRIDEEETPLYSSNKRTRNE